MSYFGKTIDRAVLSKAALRYAVVLFWFSIPVAVYNFLPLYAKQANGPGPLLLFGFLLYLVLGLPFFYWFEGYYSGPRLESKALVAFRFLPRIPLRLYTKLRDPASSFFDDEKTRVALLATLVKLFFFPLMLWGILGNSAWLVSFWQQRPFENLDPQLFYGIAYRAIVFIDVSIFAFAYIVESARLKNEIKSVEPTFFGWAVTLINYFPLNQFIREWKQALVPNVPFSGFGIGNIGLVVFLALALICYAIYLWAAMSLGARAGNLVNRGIVTTGAYAYVRHPSYISKNLAWWILAIPAAKDLEVFMILAITSTGYFFRAVTEERHLSRDSEYLEYKKKVKYRFIPGVW